MGMKTVKYDSDRMKSDCDRMNLNEKKPRRRNVKRDHES